jgi:putative radical SAM enzyme (TIGR03279 family)
MVKITAVNKSSRAYKAGIRENDVLVSINGNAVNDVLDYRFYLAERLVTLSLLRADGEKYEVKIKKGEYDDIGLDFETPLMDKKQSCKNGCIFCFIDQNPKGMRESIYFKDDDSRLSFIHGNYVTLTNMTDADIDRIIKMRMSPINISIHTTNPELRVKMMKNKRSGEVLSYLRRIKDAGLSMRGQVVLCRGVNDGDELLRTMSELSEYYPELDSVSIVPAGLTKHREGLYPLSPYCESEAREIIKTVEDFANKHYEKHGSRLFFLADEFYLKANLPIPNGENYEEYPQIENGVGMMRSFIDEVDGALNSLDGYLAENSIKKRRVAVVTGTAMYDTLSDICKRISFICPSVVIEVHKIINNFFGESISVSGLLTGVDIAEQLSGKLSVDEVLLPLNALREGEDVFLCGMSFTELEKKLSVPIGTVGSDGYEFVETVLGLEAGTL